MKAAHVRLRIKPERQQANNTLNAGHASHGAREQHESTRVMPHHEPKIGCRSLTEGTFRHAVERGDRLGQPQSGATRISESGLTEARWALAGFDDDFFRAVD